MNLKMSIKKNLPDILTSPFSDSVSFLSFSETEECLRPCDIMQCVKFNFALYFEFVNSRYVFRIYHVN